MLDRPFHETMQFSPLTPGDAASILRHVAGALEAKGYNPINQLVGYLISGDPTYITSHGNARTLIRSLERDAILEELVRSYLSR